jgi:hypothetical protein
VGLRAGLDSEARGKILLPLPGIKPRLPGHPVHTQDTILTELPWLHIITVPVRICQCFQFHCHLSEGFTITMKKMVAELKSSFK